MIKHNSRAASVRKEQRKSFYLREISSFYQQIALDEPVLSGFFITRAELSADGGICYIYFANYVEGKDFKEALETLKLYKPSMRKALAQSGHGRYVPNLIFKLDEVKGKQRRVDDILDTISTLRDDSDESPQGDRAEKEGESDNENSEEEKK